MSESIKSFLKEIVKKSATNIAVIGLALTLTVISTNSLTVQPKGDFPTPQVNWNCGCG